MEKRQQPIEDADLSALYQYWIQQTGDRMMPARSDIDPLHIPDLLPKIGLVDVLSGNGVRFRFRLIGTKLVQLSGCDFTGQSFNALPSVALRDYHYELYEFCVQKARPIFSQIDLTMRRDLDLAEPPLRHRLHNLLLPLSRDNGNIDIILFSCTLQSAVVDLTPVPLDVRLITTLDEATRHIL